MNPNTLCRACLTKEGAFQSIFLVDTVDSDLRFSLQISKMLNSFSMIQVIQGDGLPEQICTECVEKTVKMYLFKLKFEESNTILRARLNKVSSSNKENSKNKGKKESDEPLVNSEIKTESDNNSQKEILIEGLATLESGSNKSHGGKEMTENEEEIKISKYNMSLPKEDDLLSSHKIAEIIKMEELEIKDEHYFQAICEFDEPLKIEKMENMFSCEECNEFFDQKEYLVNHISSFHENQKIPTTCESGSENFEKERFADVEFNLENKRYCCDICFEGFRKISKLKDHVKTHNSTSVNDFVRKNDLKKNTASDKRLCTGKKPYKYEMFKNTFSQLKISKKNKKIHTGEKPFECEVCKKKFRRMDHLRSHKKTHTGEKPYKCDMCGKKFKQKPNLTVHIRTHTSEKPFKCDICKKKFRRMDHLRSHNKTHTGEKPYKCDMCGKKFKQKQTLIAHKKTHTSERPFECDICDKKFTESSTLSHHKKSHTGEKPFECDMCEKKFKQKPNLTTHKRTHTGEKPFECDMCDKKFGRMHHLRMHKKTHTGEKPFECDMCEKKFAQKQTLIMHKRTHTGEKPFECEVCKKKFRRMHHLGTHKKTHTGEKPFECDMCEKKFAEKLTLITHKRTHTGEKPFQCDMCEKKFTRLQSLISHNRTLHTDIKIKK